MSVFENIRPEGVEDSAKTIIRPLLSYMAMEMDAKVVHILRGTKFQNTFIYKRISQILKCLRCVHFWRGVSEIALNSSVWTKWSNRLGGGFFYGATI